MEPWREVYVNIKRLTTTSSHFNLPGISFREHACQPNCLEAGEECTTGTKSCRSQRGNSPTARHLSPSPASGDSTEESVSKKPGDIIEAHPKGPRTASSNAKSLECSCVAGVFAHWGRGMLCPLEMCELRDPRGHLLVRSDGGEEGRRLGSDCA